MAWIRSMHGENMAAAKTWSARGRQRRGRPEVGKGIHTEKSNKMQNSLSKFIIPYLYEAQQVSGDTPPIFRSLKLH